MPARFLCQYGLPPAVLNKCHSDLTRLNSKSRQFIIHADYFVCIDFIEKLAIY